MFVRSWIRGNAAAAKSRCLSQAKKRYVTAVAFRRSHTCTAKIGCNNSRIERMRTEGSKNALDIRRHRGQLLANCLDGYVARRSADGPLQQICDMDAEQPHASTC
jgi:hypothetical protein